MQIQKENGRQQFIGPISVLQYHLFDLSESLWQFPAQVILLKQQSSRRPRPVGNSPRAGTYYLKTRFHRTNVLSNSWRLISPRRTASLGGKQARVTEARCRSSGAVLQLFLPAHGLFCTSMCPAEETLCGRGFGAKPSGWPSPSSFQNSYFRKLFVICD